MKLPALVFVIGDALGGRKPNPRRIGTIAMVVLGFNLLGDGLRDLLDPRLRV